MSATAVLWLVLGIVSFGYFLNLILDILNYQTITTDIPEKVKGIYDADRYAKFVSYKRAQYHLSFFTGAIGYLITITVLYMGWLGWLNNQLLPYFENPIYLALVYFGILSIGSDLLQLPVQLYSTFGIEANYGFNKTTPATFVLDKLKGYLVGILIGGGLLYLLLYLIFRIGPEFWIYFWMVAACFMLIMNVFYTRLILPLFNKLKPLSDMDLLHAIETYAQKVGFPLTKVYEMDGSRRSSKANAFFTGLGREKKVVLFDTLIEQHEQDELVAVLAHEVGHYKHRHIILGFFLSIIQTGLLLFILSRMAFLPELSMALGSTNWQIHLNLIAFFILYSPINMILGFGTQLISRKNEYEADEFAVKTYQPAPLKNALKKLSVNSLSHLTPHPAYVWFHYSHPTLLQRLEAIDQTAGNSQKPVT